ncbi:porin family protein [uncultured Draconibacterium sp.]|uniref:porin family protein n=1 Tax=uncultured Draconibacterium sp. TaxID=1573823 RepID=UPI0025F34D13|nr:porin family protein [uncultured Draconibacterium sp.]
MKKIIFFVFVTTMLCACDCQWRLAVSEDIALIANAGMTHVNGGESYNPAFGGAIGAETTVLRRDEKSSFKTGVNISFQGASYEETISYDTYSLKSVQLEENTFSGKVNLSYLNIPLLYHYQSNSGFYAEGGLQPSFLLSAKDKPDEGASYDFKDYIKTVDIGIPVGLGYQLNDNLSLGVRAVYGLSNINTEGTEMYSSEDNDHNVTVFGVFRYTFSKK